LAVTVAFSYGYLPRKERPFYFPDSIQYHRIALNLLEGKGFSLGPGEEAIRPPLYPTFLAIVYRLSDGSIHAVRIVQAGICALQPILVHRIAGLLFGPTCARIAGWATVGYPLLLLHTPLILTEALFTTLLLTAVWLLLEGFRKGGVLLFAGAGLALGLGTLTRAGLLLFPFWMILFWRSVRPAAGRPARSALAFLAAYLIVLAPWTIRNYRLFDALVPVTTKLGHDLYEVNNPDATGGPIELRYPPGAHGLSEVEQDRFLRRAAWDHIRTHPAHFARLTFRRIGRFWNPMPNAEGFRRNTLLSLLLLLTSGPVFLLAPLGLWRQRRRWRELFPVLATVGYFALLHSILMGSIRYRVPIDPLLIVLGSGVWTKREGEPAPG
jgi:4-amino-4-deoxy-L-arabinose transferase-like glycosyltransferase